MSSQLVKQPTARPTAKWMAGVGTGGGALAVVWLAGVLGLELTPEQAGGLVLAAGAAAAWLKKNRATIADVLDRRGSGAHYDRDGDGLADG